MNDDLAAFLAARLDEDEAAAKAAAAGPWGHSAPSPWIEAVPGIIVQTRHFEDAAHIARHDPARVLREVAALRVILERYLDTLRHEAPGNQSPDEYELWLLPSLAAIWSDHPDYRAEWKF